MPFRKKSTLPKTAKPYKKAQPMKKGNGRGGRFC